MSTLAVAPLNLGDRWNEFVELEPDATYCHRYEWRAVAERAYGRACTYLAASRAGNVTGVLPLVWMPSRLAGRRLVSMPYLDMGGPLAADAESSEALLEAALELAAGLGADALELRQGSAAIPAPGDADRYRLLLPLPETAEELWARIGPKVRNQARKAERSGLSTRRVGPEGLSDFYRVFGRNMRDLGSPVHSRRFFATIFEQFGDAARLYLTTGTAGRCVGGAIAIAFRDQIVVPWASSLRSERRHCPNHSLYWRILEEAIDAGATTFDFGRSTIGTGTFRFKKQWGAAAVPLGWRVVDRGGAQAAQETLSSERNRGLVSIWKRLPVPLANLLGPAIRGRLPH